MFCKQCGTPIAPNGKFCPKCGAPVAAPAQQSQNVQHSAVPNQQGYQQQGQQQGYQQPTPQGYQQQPYYNLVPDGSGYGMVKPKKSHWKPIVITGVAVVAAGAIATTAVVHSITTKPIPALALGLNNLAEAAKDMESFHVSGTVNVEGVHVSMDFDIETNQKDEQIYAYGTTEAAGESIEVAVCIEGDDGAYAASYDGDCYAEYIDSDILADFWDACEKTDMKDFSMQKYLEDYGLDSYLDDYIDVDEVDDAYQNILKRFSKRSTQKELEDALQIETSKESGEYVYTLSPTGENLLETSKILMNILDEEAGDAIKGSWFSDAQDELDALDSDDVSELDNMGDIEWRTKGAKLTGLGYSISVEGTDLYLDSSFSYSGKKLDEISIDFQMSGYNSYDMNLTMDDFNNVSGVKDEIPSDMLSAMGMD